MHSFVDGLIQQSYLKTPAIISAFKRIKREDFVLPGDKDDAEIDAPLPIGAGQTISQPLTVAFMLELLQPKAGDKILDVGSGSGWTTALLSEIVDENGRVYGIEVIPELKKLGEENIAKYNFIKKGRVKCFLGDGRSGLPEFSPFDKILISAATEEIPDKLLEQLKIGGRLVIPIGKQYESQDLALVEKTGESKFRETRFPGFVFVPLV
jgi:protein-L-isoaspartate(D-aspartate) O-methyltransferase